jgi:hypothetical protein
MANIDKGRWTRQDRGVGRAVALLSLLGSLLLAGCLTDERRDSIRNDPLRGGGAPIKATGRDTATPSPTGTAATGNLSATPTSGAGSSASPAALASGSYSPLDPNRPLQIATPQTSQPPATNEWRGEGSFAEAHVERTEPVATARGASHTLGGFSGTSHITTYEQARTYLETRGVTWQRLETWGDSGEWKFSCRIPSPQNPYLSRAHEARAHEPIAAMRAVIDQIESER